MASVTGAPLNLASEGHGRAASPGLKGAMEGRQAFKADLCCDVFNRLLALTEQAKRDVLTQLVFDLEKARAFCLKPPDKCAGRQVQHTGDACHVTVIIQPIFKTPAHLVLQGHQLLEFLVGHFQLIGAFFQQALQHLVLFEQTFDRINLAVSHQLIRDRNAAVNNVPVLAFKPEYQGKACRLPRHVFFRHGQSNVKQTGGHHNVVAQVLQQKVKHLDLDAIGHLGKVLPGDVDPGLLVIDKKVATTGVAAKIFAESRCEQVVARGVHIEVLLEQGPNELAAGSLHG